MKEVSALSVTFRADRSYTARKKKVVVGTVVAIVCVCVCQDVACNDSAFCDVFSSLDWLCKLCLRVGRQVGCMWNVSRMWNVQLHVGCMWNVL